MKITATQLKAIVPTLSTDRAQVLAEAHNQAFAIYGITTPKQAAAIIAQEAHESGGFVKKTEGLNYDVKGLMDTFSYYKRHPELAKKHGRIDGKQKADQEAIANTVYDDANRDVTRKLGNIKPGDGWYCRGASFIQQTGFGIMSRFAAFKKVDVKTAADKMRSDDVWAVDAAVWFFVFEKKLLDEADRGEIDTISQRVNGSTEGLAERRNYYKKAVAALKA